MYCRSHHTRRKQHPFHVAVVATIVVVSFLLLLLQQQQQQHGSGGVVHALTSSELLQIRSTLLTNITNGIPYSYAGYLFSHGSNSVPIIVGGGGDAVVVAATSSNSLSTAGRLCAFGHTTYSYTTDLTSGAAKLAHNCARWTTKNKQNVSYMLHYGISQSGGSAFYNQLSGFSLNSSTNAFDEVVRPLDSVDLLIINLNYLSGEATPTQIQMISDFLNRGGGIIAVTTAWAYSVSGSKFPGNAFFAKMGVSFYTTYFESSPFLGSTKELSELNAYFKLEKIESNYITYGNVSTDDVNSVNSMLSSVYPTLTKPITLTSIETNQKAKSVYDTICGSTTITFPVSSAFQKFCVVMVDTLNKANSLPISNNPQVLAGEQFPGLPNNGLSYRNAPIVTVSTTISTSKKRWQCSGYYALPGANLTITVSDPSGISSVIVGGHTDSIAKHDQWVRWPTISSSWTINSATNATSWFIAFNGGTIYFDVSKIPLTFTATITGQVVRTPFFRSDLHTDNDWKNSIRNYPGPWVEVESDYFVINVESSYARNLTELSTVTSYWRKVMELFYELSQRPIREYKERMQIDIDISIGYMHSGYPIMAFQDQNEGTIKALNPAGSELLPGTPGRWGHYHELGHNFQEGAWTYSEATEVTTNIFSLYLEEHYPDSSNTYGKAYGVPRGLETTYKGNTQDYKGDWTSAGLLFYLDLIQAFGWVSIRKTFADYYTAESSTLPANNAEKRDQWVTRFSKVVGRNLGPFCEAWSFPISQSAKTAVSNYTSWMPNNFIVGCSVAPYGDSPCASLSVKDNSLSQLTTYEVKMVTWTPVRKAYGERYVFTFSGDALPQLQPGTISLSLLDGTTSLNTTGLVSAVVNSTSITLSTNVVEFVKSGQQLKFSFQAKNSAKIGTFTTKIKVLDSKNAVINVVERPLEFQNSIVIASPTNSGGGGINGQKSTIATGGAIKQQVISIVVALCIGLAMFVLL